MPRTKAPIPAPKIAELARLAEDAAGTRDWRSWGPYVSERQWGTVREDYSPGGDAWTYFPHDHARSRAYRWGEDGIAGWSDDQQHLCLSFAFWNGRDPILKERLFGLTNGEGNHGEDVKEIYYYLDATPTHSYLKMLYKYPQAAFPYGQLLAENQRRSQLEPEFELLDTGIFDEDRYFDVFIEYAKATPEDILVLVTIENRGPEDATLTVLPQLFFRNTWTWKTDVPKPVMTAEDQGINIEHEHLGSWRCDADAHSGLLFCDNETNLRRHDGQPDAHGYFKDAFHEYVVEGDTHAVNPHQTGTKAAAVYPLSVPSGGSKQIRLRLRRVGELPSSASPFGDFDDLFNERRSEADAFYDNLQTHPDADARRVQRQAYAGMIWSKQFYHFNVQSWLDGDPTQPAPPPERQRGRNHDWRHLDVAAVISMPDKWEYPWFAAWDLAFHCVAFSDLDPEFAKSQLLLLTRVWCMHPNGQVPAYEWSFGDVNPPVHAWATWRLFEIDRRAGRQKDPAFSGDMGFLERVFLKLLLNFTWWVNRKDEQGRNIFQGGFLGLDNIGCFDRSSPLPTGGFINQADGTSWMAMYCVNMLRIAIELALFNSAYEETATKFFEHFLSIASAINGEGDDHLGLWDESDGFYYDQLSLPQVGQQPIKILSVVGLIPLFVVEILHSRVLDRLPEFSKHLAWVLRERPKLANLISRWEVPGKGNSQLLSLLRGSRMKALLSRMLDPQSFLSDHGIRALSKAHQASPFHFRIGTDSFDVDYWPAESHNRVFGGNSNWRGPIWMPINFLLIESIRQFHHYYGDDFLVECPTGSGQMLTLEAVANELSRRITTLFLVGANGQRPVLQSHPKMATDPHFKDYLLFFEYFHADDGRGLGASHQTGWTGLIAQLLNAPPLIPTAAHSQKA